MSVRWVQELPLEACHKMPCVWHVGPVGSDQVMDPLLAVSRLPKLAERAMRASVVAALERRRVTPRVLINDALMRFERAIQNEAPEGIRPALLFTERDRIVRELRGFIDGRVAARLAADVCGVPTVLIARTDAHSANLLTADIDERDCPFVHGERTPEGFHQFNGGIKVRVYAMHCCRLLL